MRERGSIMAKTHEFLCDPITYGSDEEMFDHYFDVSEVFEKLFPEGEIVSHWVFSDMTYGINHDYGLHILWMI